mgnify:CR=1 FL=1
MGCGKSTVARQLSSDLGFSLLDTDKKIESISGKSIPELFSVSESYFRSWELTVCKSLKRLKNTVISTGGGLVMNSTCADIVKKAGFVVYLKASVDNILERTASRQDRPLLQTENPRATIDSLLSKRDPVYSSLADLIIDTDNKSIESISQAIIRSKA